MVFLNIGFLVIPWNFGRPTCICEYYGVILWYKERNQRSKKPLKPKFSLSYMDEKIKLPLLLEPLEFLRTLLSVDGSRRSTKFLENNRIYNSMFSFASTSGRVDAKINDGHGP